MCILKKAIKKIKKDTNHFKLIEKFNFFKTLNQYHRIKKF